jgi:hypothetical protein
VTARNPPSNRRVAMFLVGAAALLYAASIVIVLVRN